MMMKLNILLFLMAFVAQQMGSRGQQSIYNSQCEQFNYCNNHGYCMNGGASCMCNVQYDSANCSVCAAGYFNYPVCYSCKSYCQNGGICINDSCVCPTNATDILCSKCAPNFNGQYCTQDPIGFSIITNGTVYDVGGSSITIIGAHFNKNGSTGTSVLCRFASYAFWFSGYYSTEQVYYSSSGNVINDSALVCITSAMYPDSYNISFSLDNGTSWFSDGYYNELSRLALEVIAYCPTRLNKCSMNGQCQYGNCSCFGGFAGEKCDQCDQGFFHYPYCVSCDESCKNSLGCVNGTCICNAPYSGSRCTECPKEYNGNGCLRIPKILSVTPRLVYDSGGNNLTVTISNFDENIKNVLCKFQGDFYPNNMTDISCGYIINRTALNCLTPRMNASYRRLYISMSDGITWIDSTLYIQVNGTCPEKCYRGQCHFGKCICDTNIAGNSCLSCALGYYQFPYCYPCSDCVSHNGTCDQTSDSCICGDSTRFTGVMCTECQPNYYGPNCTNSTQLFNVVPRTMTDLSINNGINITLTGNNFYFTSLSNVICRYEVSSTISTVPAISASSSTVMCTLSNGIPRNYVIVSLSLDNGTTWVGKSSSPWMYWVFIAPTCPNDGSCSYGRCSYGQCNCAPGYSGALCDRCDNGYFGYPDCYVCSLSCANNGTCINGTCVCAERFNGIRCTECQPHYYGSQCLQIPALLSVSPNRMSDIGGENLTVIGEYFNTTSTVVLCQYRLYTYPFTIRINSGSVINSTALNCLSPRMDSSTYELYASIDNGTTWTSTYVYVFVETACPNGSNSCNLGQCRFGGCICNNYSIGLTCSSCAVGYFNFPNCYPCYYCEQNNGTCDHANDTCICGDSSRFTGTFCNLCKQNPYGSICSNNSQMMNISSTCDFPVLSTSMLNSSSMTTFMEITEVTSSHQSTSIASETSTALLTTEVTSSYQSTPMTSQMSTALLTTVTPAVTTNFYIQFTLSPIINSGNSSAYQLSIQLLAIFMSSFGIYSNQINITIIIPLARASTNNNAQIRIFNNALESAESLLTRIRLQLADSSSSLRNHEITSQLTDQSISDIRRIYICDGNIEQQTPCQTATAALLTTEVTSSYQSTPMTSQMSTALLTTVTPAVTTNFYIQFTLSPIINSGNSSAYQLSIQLLAIFMSSFGIYSNQINITIIIPLARASTNNNAQIRIFNNALESAESLLTRIRLQLADSSSSLRNHEITSQLTDQSISDIRRIYICDGNIEQQTSCQTATTAQSVSTNPQTSVLLATIIPSVIGGLLIISIVIFMIIYLRKRSGKSSSSRELHYVF